MTNQPASIGPVTVELGGSLRPLAAAPEMADLSAQIAAALPGAPPVTVQGSDSPQALRVRVRDRLWPYPPDLLVRLWLVVAPPALHDLVAVPPPPDWTGFPDAWLQAVVAGLPAGPPPPLLLEYLAALVHEILAAGPPESAFAAAPIGLNAPGTYRIAIHLHPAYLRALVPDAPDDAPLPVNAPPVSTFLQDRFKTLATDFFAEIGIRLPVPVLVPDATLAGGTLVFQIAGRRSPPTRGIGVGQFLIDATVEQLGGLASVVRPAIHPATRRPSAVISIAYAAMLDDMHIPAWTAPEVLVLALNADLRAAADRLLTVDDVEYLLAGPGESYPELVQAALARFSVQEIAAVLRALLRERIPIRDLRTILERLVQFDAIPADPGSDLLFDDRPDLGAGSPAGPAHLAFVRRGLRYLLSYRVGQFDPAFTAYLLVPPDLARAEDGAGGEAVAAALRAAVWAQVPDAGSASGHRVILTTPGARLALREVLAPEFPDLPVVAYTELRPDLHIANVVQIHLL